MRRASGETKMRPPSDFVCWAASPPGAAGAEAAAAFGALSAFTAAPISFMAFGMSCFGGATAGRSPSFSPSSSSTAMGALTFTPSLPSGTSILPILPSSTASNSIVALSVSISARMVPDLPVSPSFTSHLASLPSSMVGDSAGIRMLVAMCLSLVADGFDRLDQIIDRRQRKLFQIGGIGHRHVLARYLGRRRVQIVERVQRHARADFRTDGADRPGLFEGDDAVGLLHAFQHRVHVQRTQGAKIDHFG